MIRFIDLTGQIDEDLQMAYFNTVTEKFEQFNGRQVWDSFGDLIGDIDINNTWMGDYLKRLKNITPKGFL